MSITPIADGESADQDDTDAQVECPSCGSGYKALGGHWTGSCDPPQLTDYQNELLTGLLMGDGYLRNQQNGNSHFNVRVIKKPFLEWLDDQFGALSTGVRLKRTAEEIAKKNRESGFSSNADADDYHDYWSLQSRTLPELNDWRKNWYDPDHGKCFPENIDLTPTTMKMWFISDWHYNTSDSQNHVECKTSNEALYGDKLKSYFESLPIDPSLNVYHADKYSNGKYLQIRCSVDDTQRLFEYMGSPVPGFEYKWPESYHGSFDDGEPVTKETTMTDDEQTPIQQW